MSSEPTPDDIENLIELFNQSDWEEMHLKTDTLELFLSPDALNFGNEIPAGLEWELVDLGDDGALTQAQSSEVLAHRQGSGP
ncbi:MAG: hypothetical protein ACU85V_14415, partial [Gammaproteobacteria bacterium]